VVLVLVEVEIVVEVVVVHVLEQVHGRENECCRHTQHRAEIDNLIDPHPLALALQPHSSPDLDRNPLGHLLDPP
jgi:hypothetical protein